jgi:hypothetical protein
MFPLIVMLLERLSGKFERFLQFRTCNSIRWKLIFIFFSYNINNTVILHIQVNKIMQNNWMNLITVHFNYSIWALYTAGVLGVLYCLVVRSAKNFWTWRLYKSPSSRAYRTVKSMKLRWAQRVTKIEEERRNTYRILLGRNIRQRRHGRPTRITLIWTRKRDVFKLVI